MVAPGATQRPVVDKQLLSPLTLGDGGSTSELFVDNRRVRVGRMATQPTGGPGTMAGRALEQA